MNGRSTIAAASRWIVLGALFVIPFLVLYVSSTLFFPFITGKGFAFRILVEIAFAAWILLAAVEPKYRPKFSWTFVLYGAFVVWMFMADAFAVSPLKAFWSNFERMDGWVTLIHVFLFFIIAGSVLSADSLWRKWWLTFLSASALVSLYGVLQLMGVLAIHQGSVRLDATLGNAEYLAAYLLFGIAVALWQGIESKETWVRYALYALVALQTVILYFTATRGAILGAVGAIALGSILWMFEAGKKGRRNAGIALAVLVVLVGGFLLVRHSSFVTNEPTLSRLASISLSDGQTRFTIWHMAWEGFLARPVTGWGQEGFNYVFNTYFDPSLYGQEAWFDRAHNVFLDWLLAGGAPALLLFLALLISAVIAYYRGNGTRNERVMLTAALAAYAFQALFVFDNLFSYIPLAALLALAHTATARPWKQLQTMPAVSAASAATIGAPIVLVGFVVICWFVNVPNVSAATDLLSGLTTSGGVDKNLAYFKSAASDGSFAAQEISEQAVSFAATLAQQQGQSDAKTAFIAFAVDEINKEIQARPKDARIYLEASLVYRASGDLQDALKTTQTALALSPNKQQILIEEGTTYWQLGDNAKANADYQKAYELATANDDAAAYAAAGDFLVGNAAAGRELLIGHFGTTTVDNDVLMYVYFQLKMYDELTAILELRFKNSGSVNDGFRLASAYATFGRYADARAAIQKVIELHPDAAATGQQLLTQLQGK